MLSSVLFACDRNAVRSPMATALARHYFGRRMNIESVGVDPGELDAFAVVSMADLGIDIAKYRPKSFEAVSGTQFDLVITLSPEAHHHALDFVELRGSEVEYWPVQDPTLAVDLGLPRSAILDAYRQVRDHLNERILARLSTDRVGQL